MEIGSKLKDARNSKGLTQEQAAEALDVYKRQAVGGNCGIQKQDLSYFKEVLEQMCIRDRS